MLKKLFISSTLSLNLSITIAYATGPKFTNVAVTSGVNFNHARAQFDPSVQAIMPWLTAGGAGIAIGDYDRDMTIFY